MTAKTNLGNRKSGSSARRNFATLAKPINADPSRRARVDSHKEAMLAELRRELDLTQVQVADALDITQEGVSRIERSDARVSTLSRYVEALGGRLELRAVFSDHTVDISPGSGSGKVRRTAVGARRSTRRATARQPSGGKVHGATGRTSTRKPSKSGGPAGLRSTSRTSTRKVSRARA